MVFIGSVKYFAIISPTSNIATPESMVAGRRMRWSAERNNIRAMCGTAMPTKPIGPQNAVTVPAKRVVEIRMRLREREMLSPIEAAYRSPARSIFIGLIVATAIAKPTTITGASTISCEKVTSPNEPIVHTM